MWGLNSFVVRVVLEERSNNQFGLLASNSAIEEKRQQDSIEVGGDQDSSYATDGVTITRSTSEPTHRQPDIIPANSTTFTPRKLRSQQTKKASDLIIIQPNKITKINTKRNFEEAISPEAQQAATPINKKFNSDDNTEKTSLNDLSTSADLSGGNVIEKLD
ncbi:hypothetical protein HMPREF1544_04781 [Mucor circinelloides 1006PhL]|uniref:Uncharacterized protein n=1 Tax=Mucor circinelloides f. circinelloides (strain 1006PhL) TaxID=1220926 RepID=S2K864_MUCC1|nr:hypothetical protein HMPREF1544_04781 [Mucor circinelloides 1006PhL]